MHGRFRSNAVILKSRPLKDTSFVLKIFTKDLGLLDAWTTVSKKGKITRTLIEPLHIIECLGEKKETSELFIIREILPLHTLHFSSYSISLFLSFVQELTLKTLAPQHPDSFKFDVLCEWIKKTATWQQLPSGSYALFMKSWAHAMGLMPRPQKNSEEKYFSLPEGCFKNRCEPFCLDESFSAMINKHLREDFFDFQTLPEKKIVEFWMKYLSFHVQELKNLNSVSVFKELNKI